MARQRKTDRDLQGGKARLAGLKSIDKDLDLGGGVSVMTLEESLTAAQAKLDQYNQSLGMPDQYLNEYKALLNTVNDLAGRSLKGVGVKFGEDSSEYEMAGGVRKSERKRPTRKPKNESKP